MRCLVTQIYLEESHENHMLNTLIDNGAQENFLSQKFVLKEGLQTKVTDMSAHTLDSHSFAIYRWIACETHATDSGGVAKSLIHFFLTINILYYNVILRWPWLKHENSDCDWRKAQWSYRTSKVLTVTDFKKKSAECQIYAVCNSQADVMCFTSGVQLACVQTTEVVLSEKYNDYSDIFSEKGASWLADRTKVSHAIDIKERREPLYRPIYSLSVEELWVLRKYLASSITKEWIQKSTSSAESPILFVKKQNSSLKLCVNYQRLNKIMIKN